MRADPHPRPGFVWLACGVIFLGLSAARLATAGDPGRLWFELGHAAVAAVPMLWGWSRLRRAKAARPDLTWLQFLHDDLIVFGVIALLLTAWAALSPEQRDDLVKSFLELAELISTARGPH